MIGRKKRAARIDRKPDSQFEIGDMVSCQDFDGLPGNVIQWLQLQPLHKVKHVWSKDTDPILILEPIEGVESPKLGNKLFPFMSERFIKNTDGN